MSTEPFSNKFDDNGELKNRQIGRYILQDRLGSGGTATVYQAYDQVNGQSVALKVLPSTADEKTLERFRREAMTSGGLRHPHIVRTIQVGVASHAGDIAYIAMELIDGESLGQLLTKRGRLHPEESCSLLAPIASALAYAHDEGIVHRDVKPSNILLNPSRPSNPNSVQLDSVDNPIVPMLSDFGIARALDAPDLTASGRTVGTPAYMAPEQCRGGQHIDGRADIYALTAVLFRCLVGRQPFLGNTPQILHAHVYEPLKIEDDIYRRLSPLVVEILQNGMAKEPHERYSNAYEFAEALASAAGITLTSEVNATTDDALPTVTLPSIEALSEPPTISETVIIPASATVSSTLPSVSEGFIPAPSAPASRGQEQAGDPESTELIPTRSQSRQTTRQTIRPPRQNTETTSSVHTFERAASESALSRSLTIGQRLERIRWGWFAFASIGVLLFAGLSALFFGAYRTPNGLGDLFSGDGVIPTATSINSDSSNNTPIDEQAGSNNGSVEAGETATQDELIILAPDETGIARVTEEAALASTAVGIALTATVNSASTATAVSLQLTSDVTKTPRFIPATAAPVPAVTATPQPALPTPTLTPTPVPPAAPTIQPTTIPPTPIPTVAPTATQTVPPTVAPTATSAPPNPTATWTPALDTPEAVSPTEIPVESPTNTATATEVLTDPLTPTETLLPAETLLPTETLTQTATPVPAEETPEEVEAPLTDPTATWTPPASDSTDNRSRGQ